MTDRTDNREHVSPANRAEWREWLARHHATSPGVWLILHKKHAIQPGIGYEDAVEEALCFGWIDSRMNPLDNDRWKQLITPRHPGSTWSKLNKERVERLTRDGRMAPRGLAAVEAAKQDGSWNKLDAMDNLTVPDDLAAALALDPTAERNFLAFSASSRRMLLWWIASARRPQTRAKRIAEVVSEAALNRRAVLDRD